MFTGLIAGQGELTYLQKNSKDARLGIRALFDFDKPIIGESVAINGVCLTVETAIDNILSFYASKETLDCSNIGLLGQGAKVNMERALRLGDRLGGHLVSGHIDCLGKVLNIYEVENSTCYRIGFPNEFAPFIIPKGSIALDGVSLTVNACGLDFLEVNIIPETIKVTTISKWKVGQPINMEMDLIGKYILRSSEIKNSPQQSKITKDFLAENGFF